MKFFKKNIEVFRKERSGFSNNPISGNILITLFFLTFIVIAIDICSELAVQKDEIGMALCVFEDGYTELILSIDFLPDIERPLLYELTNNNFAPSESIRKSSVTDRGPPEINL